MALPLAPYSVIDLTRARSGPTCVRQLAEMGARVIQGKSDARGPPGAAIGAVAYRLYALLPISKRLRQPAPQSCHAAG